MGIVQTGVEAGIAKKNGKDEFAMNFGGCTGISFSDFGVSADVVFSFMNDLKANIDDTDFTASVAINTPFANVGVSTGVVFNNEGERTGHSFNLGYGVGIPLTGFPFGDVSFEYAKLLKLKECQITFKIWDSN